MSCFIAAIDDVNDLHCNISRYEAESLLDEKPEGSFLLRDSAQDEYLFSVSFRRYGRSLHARIEEQGHRFSFDCHDPGVFMSRNIPQLLDHYKVSNSRFHGPYYGSVNVGLKLRLEIRIRASCRGILNIR